MIEKHYDRRLMLLQRSVDVSERLPKLVVLCAGVLAGLLLVLISMD